MNPSAPRPRQWNPPDGGFHPPLPLQVSSLPPLPWNPVPRKHFPADLPCCCSASYPHLLVCPSASGTPLYPASAYWDYRNTTPPCSRPLRPGPWVGFVRRPAGSRAARLLRPRVSWPLPFPSSSRLQSHGQWPHCVPLHPSLPMPASCPADEWPSDAEPVPSAHRFGVSLLHRGHVPCSTHPHRPYRCGRLLCSSRVPSRFGSA